MTTTNMTDKAVKPVKVTIEIHVEIERHPNGSPFGWGRMTAKEQQADLESWARGLREFFRDHRSMDVNSICVVPVVEEQCSGCGKPWETMEEEGVLSCSYCGVAVEKT